MSWVAGDYLIPFKIADLGTAETLHAAIPTKSKVVAVRVVQYATTTTPNTGMTVKKNDTAIGATIIVGTVAFGGAVGDVTEFNLLKPEHADLAFEEGDSIAITTDGNGTGPAKAMVHVHMRRAA